MTTTNARKTSPKPVKLGQIVTFQLEGERRSGRVLKGGKIPKVSYSQEYDVNLPNHRLVPVENPPQPDAELSEWSVVTFRETGPGRDGMLMTAAIARNGQKVIEANNYGDGGPNEYRSIGKGTQNDIDDWQTAVKQYLQTKGLSTIVADELWVAYAWRLQPTGLSFADYISSH